MNVYELKPIRERIEGNPYVGRGIIIGCSEDGTKAVTAYFIMGRSENSRNRIFEMDGEDLKIKPFDESKVEDPSLIIYYPIRNIGSQIIVTNGDQTDTIYDHIAAGNTFESALRMRQFEPDGPNWTPRISGILDFGHEEGFTYKMSILKSADEEGSACSRYFFEYPALPGTGHFIHTYVTDGNPIPTFQGEPERIEIPNDIEEFFDEIWDNLDADNRISLYVQYTDIETGETDAIMMNKHEQETE